ncbi:hypothetical protein HS088_TW07G00463 [Tripterygium wilfordii]|uniref:Germin-like protein n=1 Tax=Tripterygium wilfordii TaxID=458696 RepID=A0A7J7DEY3_TRIWF|nr:germin-like protein 9-3 [Tripterygium wilfordii]KAF5744882.1 hypothetical protein HS088_TW07G00463 [Tripterygium wilfordii]
MVSRISMLQFFLLVIASLAIIQMTKAGDEDILCDFLGSKVDAKYFTYKDMRSFEKPAAAFTVMKASRVEFPALNGQSVSLAVLQFPVNSVNPPHIHPRSAELLLVRKGCLQVGFVDTTNKFYNQTLRTGDIFVFPKGLVHYQYNADPHTPALAISAFGSANAGTVSIPATLFTTGIDDNILEKSFKTDAKTIQALKTGLGSKQ